MSYIRLDFAKKEKEKYSKLLSRIQQQSANNKRERNSSHIINGYKLRRKNGTYNTTVFRRLCSDHRKRSLRISYFGWNTTVSLSFLFVIRYSHYLACFFFCPSVFTLWKSIQWMIQIRSIEGRKYRYGVTCIAERRRLQRLRVTKTECLTALIEVIRCEWRAIEAAENAQLLVVPAWRLTNRTDKRKLTVR